MSRLVNMLTLPDTLNLATLDQHMVCVEGGTFEMGGEGHGSEKPIHPVQLDDYEICRYLVTQQLWYEVMGAYPKSIAFRHPDRPVEGVSWNDITNRFLPKLREITGIEAYKLPTEAQWEYAARGGIYRNSNQHRNQDYTYAGSDALKEGGWYRDNAHQETLLLGLKRPNALGLYDMSGNVLEWCRDWYDREYYQYLVDQYGKQPAPNPTGPSEGSYKVVRGGSWLSDSDYARVSDRLNYLFPPSDRGILVGFRLCRY